MKKIKAFFACSMRGGFPYVSREFLAQIPDALEEIGLELVSRHQTQPGIIQVENKLTAAEIHDRDYAWLDGCGLVVAEISNPSDGAGGEIADAVHLDRHAIALYQRPENEISAYTRGKLEGYAKGRHTHYRDLEHFKLLVKEFIWDMGIEAE